MMDWDTSIGSEQTKPHLRDVRLATGPAMARLVKTQPCSPKLAESGQTVVGLRKQGFYQVTLGYLFVCSGKRVFRADDGPHKIEQKYNFPGNWFLFRAVFGKTRNVRYEREQEPPDQFLKPLIMEHDLSFLKCLAALTIAERF